jgi:hypothetical protein
LESNSNNEYYLSTAAFITYNLGNDNEAKSYFDKALKINPNLYEVLSEKKRIAFNKMFGNKATTIIAQLQE